MNQTSSEKVREVKESLAIAEALSGKMTRITRRELLAATGGIIAGIAGTYAGIQLAPPPTREVVRTVERTQTTTVRETVAPTPPASYGGKLVIAFPFKTFNLDPMRTGQIEDINIAMLEIFDPLYHYDWRKGEVTLNGLATSFPKKIDDKTFEIPIRKGVKFHDGTELKASDVKYSIDAKRGAIPNLVPVHKAIYAFITSSEVVNASTVRVGFGKPHGAFLLKLTPGTLGIVPEKLHREMGADFNRRPVGTGPFKFVEWVEGDHITVRKNPDYFIKGSPFLDEITWLTVPDVSLAVGRLIAGTVDIVANAPYKDFDRLARQPGMKLEEVRAMYGDVIYFNNLKPYFEDKRLRQAVAYAINKERLIKEVFYGHAEHTSSSGIPKWAGGGRWWSEKSRDYPYDPSKAKELLTAAGYRDGFSFELLVPATPEEYPNQAILIKDDLGKVGIKMSIKTGEKDPLHAFLNDGSGDALITRAGYFILSPDPDTTYKTYYYWEPNIQAPPKGPEKFKGTKGFASAYWWWHGSEAERAAKLIDDAAAEVVPEKRDALYRQLHEIVSEEIPILQLHHWNLIHAYRENVRNFFRGSNFFFYLNDTYKG